jgi:diaminopimelate epimerase
MELDFTKMHGLGNDFMIVRRPEGMTAPAPALVRRWADRRTGVGFDSLLLIEPARSATAAARYRVINADGNDAEQCGNGARCIATYLTGNEPTELVLESAAGPVAARVLGDGRAAINLGAPRFEPAAIPFAAEQCADRYRVELADGAVELGAVSFGNPHAVISVDSVDTAPVGILGAELGHHRRFPAGVNVGFMQRVSATEIRLRVFERGVGETRACGTGAAAAAVVGRRWGQLDARVTVRLPGGSLIVEWSGPGSDVWQTGPTARVYEGRIEI